MPDVDVIEGATYKDRVFGDEFTVVGVREATDDEQDRIGEDVVADIDYNMHELEMVLGVEQLQEDPDVEVVHIPE